MIEGIAMCIALAGMGIYFVKSTDLPKDMKQRSEQMRASSPIATNSPKKYSFPVAGENKPAVAVMEKNDNLLKEMMLEAEMKRQEKIALHNKKIDEITLIITTLEQQIKDNHERNAMIQAQINLHLETLKTLKETQIA